MATHRTQRTLVGEVAFRSHFMSNQWILEQNGQPVAQVRRLPRHRLSSVRLSDGTMWTMEPRGWGALVMVEDGTTIARADRKSFVGRLWEISSQGFAFNLVSRPLPRRWYLGVGNESVAELSGSPFSYNRLQVHSAIGVPIAAILLAWQVVVRPWEAAAFPLTRPTPRRSGVNAPDPRTEVPSPAAEYVRSIINGNRTP